MEKWSRLLLIIVNSLRCRKNSNIIRTIFTKNRSLVAGVRIIHVNYKTHSFVVGFSHQIVITHGGQHAVHWAYDVERRSLSRDNRRGAVVGGP